MWLEFNTAPRDPVGAKEQCIRTSQLPFFIIIRVM